MAQTIVLLGCLLAPTVASFVIYGPLLLSQFFVQEIRAPERPQNVPPDAHWHGGPDGGDWFACKPLKMHLRYRCTIYNEWSGNVINEGEYELKAALRMKDGKDSDLREYKIGDLPIEPRYYDGKNIPVHGTLYLEPVPDI